MSKIFVVDHEDFTRSTLCAVLECNEHLTIPFRVPSAALKDLVAHSPDMVVANFGTLRAEWLCQEIRKLPEPYNETPVIFMMSSNTYDRHSEVFPERLASLQKMALINHGANDVIITPCNMETALDVIETYLALAAS